MAKSGLIRRAASTAASPAWTSPVMNSAMARLLCASAKSGLMLDRLPVALDGLRVILLAEPDQAQVVVGGGGIGAGLDHRLDAGDGLVEAAGLAEFVGQAELRLRAHLALALRRLQQRQGLVQPALLGQGLPQAGCGRQPGPGSIRRASRNCDDGLVGALSAPAA